MPTSAWFKNRIVGIDICIAVVSRCSSSGRRRQLDMAVTVNPKLNFNPQLKAPRLRKISSTRCLRLSQYTCVIRVAGTTYIDTPG